MNTRVLTRVLTAIIGLLLLAFGLWAFFDARGFYDQLAAYPPFNEHLFHDVGAFQIGIGTTMLFALFRRDALQVVLWGTFIGTAMHGISHILDRDLGGRDTDPIAVSAIAVVVLVAAVLHQRQRRI